ncbi:MAG: outer membrane lipoprotein-sorting protein [Candidatus Rokubacteria bacterium]|nr:outer membrane lipoprotein-sorting protein [Candidatus Rokubacteria bacterium]
MTRLAAVAVLVVSLGLALSASAQQAQQALVEDLSTLDILAAADAKRGDVHGAAWTLSVTEPDGTAAALEVQARNQDFLATYRQPAAQAGQKILERGQNMWFIAPGASRPVPISPRQKLLGAASYGDIAGQRWSSDYRAVSRNDSTEDGRAIIIMDLVANSPHATYEALTLYIDAEDLAVVRSEMKTSAGEVLKSATYAYGNSVPGRYQAAGGRFDTAGFISEMTIVDRNNAKTVLKYQSVQFRPIPPQTFVLSNVMATR